MPATLPRSKTPRPQCKGCPIYQAGPGCGFLDAGMPCAHRLEKWRWYDAQPDPAPVIAPEDPMPIDGQLMLF